MRKYNKKDVEIAKKLQDTLIKIHQKKPVFFNIVQYKKMGLITTTMKRGGGMDIRLTAKAKRLLDKGVWRGVK